MKRPCCFLLGIFFLLGGYVWGQTEVGRDTLSTRMGDRLIVPYECTSSGDGLILKLKPAIKRLGKENARKYGTGEDLTVVIFDRKGAYKDATFSGDVTPTAFMVPSLLDYTPSHEGYYLLHESPELSFRFRDGATEAELSLPAFLAYHPKKGKYKLIARCGEMRIVLKGAQGSKAKDSQKEQGKAVTSIELEVDNSDMTRVLDCIANINARLPQEDRLPMSESLEGDVRLLREWKYSVTDVNLKEKVNETLEAYEQKKRSLEDAAATLAQAEQKRVEEEMKAQSEAEADRQREEEEKGRKRTLWMVIGGIVAAAGAFVGNQVMQTRRNNKNQKNMMDMQQGLMKKAEAEAKRRTVGKARSEMTHAANKARGKAEQTVKDGFGKMVTKSKKNNNKKNFSI